MHLSFQGDKYRPEQLHIRNTDISKIYFPTSIETQKRVIINVPFKFGLRISSGCNDFRTVTSIPKPPSTFRQHKNWLWFNPFFPLKTDHSPPASTSHSRAWSSFPSLPGGSASTNVAAASWFLAQKRQGKTKLDANTVGYVVSLCVFKGAQTNLKIILLSQASLVPAATRSTDKYHNWEKAGKACKWIFF